MIKVPFVLQGFTIPYDNIHPCCAVLDFHPYNTCIIKTVMKNQKIMGRRFAKAPYNNKTPLNLPPHLITYPTHQPLHISNLLLRPQQRPRFLQHSHQLVMARPFLSLRSTYRGQSMTTSPAKPSHQRIGRIE